MIIGELWRSCTKGLTTFLFFSGFAVVFNYSIDLFLFLGVFMCFRLLKFDKRNWRASYKALIVLEYLLTHGPESVAQDFQTQRDVIREMERFQHIDEKGYLFDNFLQYIVEEDICLHPVILSSAPFYGLNATGSL